MLFIALLVSTAVAAQRDSANPLARAENGQIQCYHPDVAKKTCQSIASYRRTARGTYDNKAVVAIGNGASLETHTPVTLKDGAVCGLIRADDVSAGTLRAGDRVVTAEEAKPILARIAQALTSFAGKEICTRYEPSGADFTAKITIAGTDRPDQSETVKWVDASDGYTVSR
jgi:hypothetical protein